MLISIFGLNIYSNNELYTSAGGEYTVRDRSIFEGARPLKTIYYSKRFFIIFFFSENEVHYACSKGFLMFVTAALDIF